MSAIKGGNTKPELIIRKGLHKLGFRYRLHDKTLPGKPDMVFPKYSAVIQVNGCFWHMHNCWLFQWPATRIDFWRTKIESNKKRDNDNTDSLLSDGWRVLQIWECALEDQTGMTEMDVIMKASAWLISDKKQMEIKGSKKA
jgi:DNA mismatch endonuclease (patch repair protein)